MFTFFFFKLENNFNSCTFTTLLQTFIFFVTITISTSITSFCSLGGGYMCLAQSFGAHTPFPLQQDLTLKPLVRNRCFSRTERLMRMFLWCLVRNTRDEVLANLFCPASRCLTQNVPMLNFPKKKKTKTSRRGEQIRTN